MKIYAIALVKNEADIIEANLRHASAWASKILVYDNGSTDNTWELVQKMKDQVILPWKQEARPFYDGLRGGVFNAFKHELQEGDWWAFLDADEFMLEDPRVFLQNVPLKYHFVCKCSMDFSICREDLQEFEFTGRFEEDRKNIQYYSPFGFSEKRFFRHRPGLEWWEGHNLPQWIGPAYPQRLLVSHYRWRSPQQIQTRLQTRWQTLEQGYDGWDHFKAGEDWRRYLQGRIFLFQWKEGRKPRFLWVRNTFRDWTITTWGRLLLNWLGFWPRHRWLEGQGKFK